MIITFSIGRKTYKDLLYLSDQLTKSKFAKTLHLKIAPARIIDTSIKNLIRKDEICGPIKEKQGKKVVTSINIAQEELEELSALSIEREISIPELIRRAVIFQLDKIERDFIRLDFLSKL